MGQLERERFGFRKDVAPVFYFKQSLTTDLFYQYIALISYRNQIEL